MQHQIDYVFEKWFEVFDCIFQSPLRRWFSPEQGMFNFQLSYSFKRSHMNVAPELDWLQVDTDNVQDRRCFRLACFTPLPFNAKNAAANVQGSSLLAITEEINKVNLLFKLKNNHDCDDIFAEVFKPGRPLLSQINYFLRITLKSADGHDDELMKGLFESRLRFLRDCLEDQLCQQIYQKFFRRPSTHLVTLDSTGGDVGGIVDALVNNEMHELEQ